MPMATKEHLLIWAGNGWQLVRGPLFCEVLSPPLAPDLLCSNVTEKQFMWGKDMASLLILGPQ